MTLSTNANDLLNDLIIADAGDNGHALPSGARAALLAVLTAVLVSPDRLNDHVRYLRKQLGTRFRHRKLLDETTSEAVLRGGLAVLDDAALARLALNPVALAGLADEIDERQPAGWAEALDEDSLELFRAHGGTVPPLEEIIGPTKFQPARLAESALHRRGEGTTSWKFKKSATECEWLEGDPSAAESASATVDVEWRESEGSLMVCVGGLLRQGPGARVEVTWRAGDGSVLAKGELVDRFGLVQLPSPTKQAPQAGERLEVLNTWQSTPEACCKVRVALTF